MGSLKKSRNSNNFELWKEGDQESQNAADLSECRNRRKRTFIKEKRKGEQGSQKREGMRWRLVIKLGYFKR